MRREVGSPRSGVLELISRPWQSKLGQLVAGCQRSLLIATPYIKRDAASWLVDTLHGRQRAKRQPQTTVMTDVSPASTLRRSLDIDALLLLAESLQDVVVVDVRRLHAKVYVADERRALVTSGNLTLSAFNANYEYGVLVTDARLAKTVASDLLRYAQNGRQISRAELELMSDVSRDFTGQDRQTAERLTAGARLELAREWDEIAETFGAPAALLETGSVRFKEPILAVLRSRGPLTTKQLCDAIQHSWPDLCDDSIIRVAKDGTRKKQWRHDIHTAQETLQRRSLLRRDSRGLWHVREGAP